MDNNISPVTAFFKNKWVRLVLVIDAIVLVVVIVMLIMNAMKTSVLNFNVTPVDATIAVNGNTNYENGSYRMMPGTYEIEISHDGMKPKSFKVELGDDTIVNIVTFLVGEDGEFSFYELKENYDSYLKLAEMVAAGDNVTTDQDKSAEEFIAKFQKNYEILSILPIMDKTPTGYGLEYGVNYQYRTLVIRDGRELDECVKTLCLYVTDSQSGEEENALAEVKKNINNSGYDAKDFQIVYKVVNYE